MARVWSWVCPSTEVCSDHVLERRHTRRRSALAACFRGGVGRSFDATGRHRRRGPASSVRARRQLGGAARRTGPIAEVSPGTHEWKWGRYSAPACSRRACRGVQRAGGGEPRRGGVDSSERTRAHGCPPRRAGRPLGSRSALASPPACSGRGGRACPAARDRSRHRGHRAADRAARSTPCALELGVASGRPRATRDGTSSAGHRQARQRLLTSAARLDGLGSDSTGNGCCWRVIPCGPLAGDGCIHGSVPSNSALCSRGFTPNAWRRRRAS